MAQKVAPLYGRFSFPTIDEFIQRIQQVASQYLAPAQFSAYLTTYDQQSFYGLDYQELTDTFLQNRGRVKSISTSATTPEDRSVNISIRFTKDSDQGEGQYVIGVGSTFGNREVRDMLAGQWIPPKADFQERKKLVGEVLGWLIQYQELKEQRKRNRELEKKAKVRPPSTPRPGLALSSIEDRFHFDDLTPTNDLIELLQDLAGVYFDETPFEIRLITRDGESFPNIGLAGLQRILEKRRNLILSIVAQNESNSGETIELTMGFGPTARRQNLELRVISRYSRDIRAHVREILDDGVDYLDATSSVEHDMFAFDEREFSVQRTIRVVQQVAEEFLEGEMPTAFVSTQQGKTYPALPLSQLPKVYHQYQGNLSFLLFGVNQALSGQTFSLMFQFSTSGQRAYGSLSIMWGSEALQERIRNYISRALDLKKHRASRQNPAPTPNERGIKSLFSQGNFRVQPRTCLVFMPLEAYWSDALWMRIQQTLRSIGWDSHRAGDLYAENILEGTWRAVNEAEVLIADLTYKHPDVFYKIGMAHTLGKKVILITQHARDLPPDFQQFPHVVYDNNLPGLQRLSDRIVELLKMS